MGKIVKVVSAINRICIALMIVLAVLVYVFGMAMWTLRALGGITALECLAIVTYVTLGLSLVSTLIIHPLYFGHLEKEVRLGAITALGNEVFNDGDRELALEFVSIMSRHDKIRYIVSAVIALVVFFLVRVSPIGEFISIAICVFGPLPVGMLRMGSMMKRRELNPELFDAVQELYITMRQMIA